jgi:hypothetical protein
MKPLDLKITTNFLQVIANDENSDPFLALWTLSKVSHLPETQTILCEHLIKFIPRLKVIRSEQTSGIKKVVKDYSPYFVKRFTEVLEKAKPASRNSVAAYLLDVLCSQENYDRGLMLMTMHLAVIVEVNNKDEESQVEPLFNLIKRLAGKDHLSAYISQFLNKVLESAYSKRVASKISPNIYSGFKSRSKNIESRLETILKDKSVEVLAGSKYKYWDNIKVLSPLVKNAKEVERNSQQTKRMIAFQNKLKELQIKRTALKTKKKLMRISLSKNQWKARLSYLKAHGLIRKQHRVNVFWNKISARSLNGSRMRLGRFFSAVPEETIPDITSFDDPFARFSPTTAFVGTKEVDHRVVGAVDEVMDALNSDTNNPNYPRALTSSFKSALAKNKNQAYAFIDYLLEKVDNHPRASLIQHLVTLELTRTDPLKRGLPIVEDIKLVMPCKLVSGTIQLNYNKYKVENSLGAGSLQDKSLIRLLERQAENFDRLEFKKLLTLYLSSVQQVSDHVLKAVISVCRQVKTPQILLDFFFLAGNRGTIWSSEHIKMFVECLQNFTVYNEEILSVLLHYIESTGQAITVDMLRPYFNRLVKNRQYEELLYFFDRSRTLNEQRRYRVNNSVSGTENTKLLGEFEERSLSEVKRFLSDFVSYLVENQLLEQGEMLYKSILQKKWLETQQDYINGLRIYNDDEEMFQNIYQDFKENPNVEKSQKHLEEVMEMIAKNPMLHGQLLHDIIDTYVLKGGMQVTDSFISRAVTIYDTTLNFKQIMDFVLFMDKHAIGIRYNTRIKFYELFKKCQDEEERSLLFSRLNQNVLKGKAEGNIRRQIAENFSNLKQSGSEYFEEEEKEKVPVRKRNIKLNPKKLAFKALYDSIPENKITVDEVR